MDLFTKVNRKDEFGRVAAWLRTLATPRFAPADPAYMTREDEELRDLTERIKEAGVEAVGAEG
jgi:hypothetical protein